MTKIEEIVSVTKNKTKKIVQWFFSSKKRKLIFSLFLVLLIILPTYFIFFHDKAGASWWNSDWFYRKSIQVTNNTTAENNVYITLTLDTSDTAKFQTDCGDIRFIQNNGNILPHYIVSGCGTSSTIIHTNFEVLDAGSQTIDFYYGNPTVENGFSSADFSTQASNYTIGTISPEQKGPSPVLYLSLDEGFGTTAHDETSNRNDGTIVGATWKDEASCKNGKCLEFDGNGDYVEIADNPSLDLSEELTLEAWIKPQATNLNNQTILSKIETPSEPTKIYRSVGPSATTAIAVGTTNAMTIIGDRATFATALPDNVGVGDAIQYDDDDDGDIDANDSIVFISSRISNVQYTISNAAGGLPVPVNADLNWSLFRAYTSLANAEKGVENTGIDSDLRNFDDWTAGGDATTDDVGKDLVASNEQWNIACYANGTTADTARFDVDGWVTGFNNYIKIFTPVSANETGMSQRHTGKWDDNKYKSVVTSGNYIRISYTQIIGLQISNSGDYTAGIYVNASSSNSIIDSCIIKAGSIPVNALGGIVNGGAINTIVKNTIVYGYKNGTDVSFRGIEASSGSLTAYNVTIANSYYGFYQSFQNIKAINTISFQNDIGHNVASSTYRSGTDYNISSDATAPGTNSKINTTVSFISTTAGSEDFHLSPTDTAAKDSGAYLSGDGVFPFASDIDGQGRDGLQSVSTAAGAWDIGADEAQATQIFRSVAPAKTDALENGTENSLIIVGNTATFQRALADNIGVGDVIQYDDDSDGDIDASDSLAFITGRISNFEFRISNVSGGTPVPVNSDTDWSLFRAYTSLANAESGTENTGIDSDLRNFDTWSGGKDLVASKEQWNIACYGNGTTADTDYTSVNGWTTGKQNFVKIYTPVNSSEVGVSQRHNGKWSGEKYRLSVDDHVFGNSEDYSIVDGLQIEEVSSGSRTVVALNETTYLINNIIRGNAQGLGAVGIQQGISGRFYYISNNIIFNITGNAISDSSGSGGFGYIYNNTIFNSGTGANLGTKTNSSILKNNIFSNNTTNVTGTVANGSDYNVTNQSSLGYTVTGGGNTHDKLSQTFNFISTTSGSEDLHLTPNDTVARNAGVDLATDPNLPVNTDIDGERRDAPAGRLYDIGADEAVATKIYRSVGPGNTTALANDNAHENTVSVTSGVATFNVALPNRVGVGDAVLIDTNSDNAITLADTLLFIHGRNSSLSYDLRTHTGATPTDITSNDTYQIFRAYTSLANAEAGTKNTSIPITFNGGNRDLVANNEEWNVACYGDAVDTTAVTVDGWVTGAENFINIYTPVNSSEVGVTQRHNGKWDEGKYKLIVSAVSTYNQGISVRDDYVKIDGVQINIIDNGFQYSSAISTSNITALNNKILLLNNILKGTITVGRGYGINNYDTNPNLYISNNIIYDFNLSNSYGINDNVASAYVYNNVVHNCNIAIYGNSNVISKNNIVQNCTDGYNGAFNTTSDFNISNLASDAPGANSKNSTTVTFRDAANKDFRLAMTDTAAKGAGLNLSNDVNLPITNDIEEELRPSLTSNYNWDIGADQIFSTIHNNYSLNLKTNYPVSNFSTSQKDQDNFSSGDINLEANTWSHLVYKRNADSEELFINGSKKDSGTISNFVKTNNGKLYLGAENSNSKNSFKGLLDDVRLYNYARTDSEVKKDTTAGSSGRAATRAAEGVSVAMGDKASSISDGLVGYWKMDEASWNGTANEVKDASGNNNHGVAVGGASTTAGKFGNGGGFDAVDDYVNMGSGKYTASNTQINGLTYSTWFKLGPTVVGNNYSIAGAGSATSNSWYAAGGLRVTRGSSYSYVTFSIYDGTYKVASTPQAANLQEGVWYHAVGIYDPVDSKIKIYLNGKLQNESDVTKSGITFEPLYSYIGKNISGTASNYFSGNIDETRIYNRALSSDEIQQLYQYAPGPVLHLKMDEKSGTTAFDSSGNGNNGTLTNGPIWENGKIGGATKFDGADDYIRNSYNADNLKFDNNDPITVSAWINPSNIQESVGTWIVGQSFEIVLRFNNTTNSVEWLLNSFSTNDRVSSPANSIITGEWNYVTGVYDGTNLSIYVNGKISGSVIPTGVYGGDIHDFFIGTAEYQSAAYNFNGSIDDVKIYNYARTQEQILEDMGAQGGGGAKLQKPILDLSFDEGQGATAFDASGNGNNGTLVSGATGANTTATMMWDKGGKFGGAVEFDGVNDYINSATGSMDSIIRGNVASISMWVKHNSIAQDNQAYFNLRANDSNDYYVRRLSAGGFMRWCQNINGVSHCVNTTNSVNDMNWHHMVFIINGASLNSWYMDGKLQQTIALLNNLSGLVGSANIYVGSRSSSSYQFNGNIDEVKIYNYALGEDEIKTLYNDSSAMVMGDDASRNNNGTAVTGDNKDYCVPGDTAKCDKPVLELSLNEKSGTTAKDSSGNGNNGTLTGGPVWDRGKISGGVSFDGVDDGVNVPNSTPLNFAAGADMTISTWVYPKSFSDSYKSIIWKGTSGVANNYYIKVSNNGRIDYYGGTQSSSGVNFNAWNHISISKTGSNVAYYINGMFAGTAVNNNSGSAPTEPLRIGSDKDTSSTAHFLGSIDEVKIYNYARTPAQIAWDYNQGAPIDHWTFNEGTGTTAHSLGEGKNHSTITGATWKDESECKSGKCLSFDGTGDYVNIDSVVNSFNKKEGSFSAWVKRDFLDTVGETKYIFHLYGNNGNYHEIRYNNITDQWEFNVMRAYISNSVTKDATTIPQGEWTHVLMTWNESNADVAVYINGASVGSNSTGGDYIFVPIAGRIGAARTNNYVFDGQIDDPKIYNYALTAEQVKQDYNGGVVNFR